MSDELILNVKILMEEAMIHIPITIDGKRVKGPGGAVRIPLRFVLDSVAEAERDARRSRKA
jgi:hypothetical protein